MTAMNDKVIIDMSFTSEEEVELLLRNKGVNIVNYNPIVSKVVNMNKEEVSRLTLDTVTDYIVMLGQNLIYLDNQYSIQRYIHTKLNTQFEEILAGMEKESKGRNVAERRSEVFNNYPELKELKEKVDESKRDKEILEGKTEILKEFLNTLKRKQDVLLLEANNQYRTNR